VLGHAFDDVSMSVVKGAILGGIASKHADEFSF
jgi:hypothetical protein